MSRSWLRGRPAGCGDGAALSLVAVPHAGAGAASFARWLPLLGRSVRVLRVQLPGREDVTAEAPLRRVDDVVAVLGPQVLRAARGAPVALYGHSMGALVAYELARAMTTAGVPPVHLAVSGRRAPHLPARRPTIHRLSDDELLGALDAMAAVPGRPAGPARTPAQRAYALRVTRADLELNEVYRHRPAPGLAVPVLALVGRDDPIVDHDEVLAWGERTTGVFAAEVHPGGHFFHHERREQLVATLHRHWEAIDGAVVPKLPA